jgi:hypothetical protein
MNHPGKSGCMPAGFGRHFLTWKSSGMACDNFDEFLSKEISYLFAPQCVAS